MAKRTPKINIGKTDCEQLAWAVNLIQGKFPSTDQEWDKVQNEIAVFAALRGPLGFPPPVIPRFRQRYEQNILNAFSEMIGAALRGEYIPEKIHQPRITKLDPATGRFYESVDFQKDDVTLAAIRGLNQLIVGCGHMLRECQAPGKLRPGRKAKAKKTEKKSAGEICGTVFVAKRKNQLYCSSACLNRTITRRKRGQM